MIDWKDAFRLLFTGSRYWTDEDFVWSKLDEVRAMVPDRPLIVVHGMCKTGGDMHVHRWVVQRIKNGDRLVREEPHPAAWGLHGKSAGPRRNQGMVDRGADLCLAMILNDSTGASGCADMAQAAGIPVRRFKRIGNEPKFVPTRRHRL